MRIVVCALVSMGFFLWAEKRPEKDGIPPLDIRVAEAARVVPEPPSPGSIWSPGSRMADAARDLRANQVDDILTIQVVESASAVARGTTKTQRSSAVSSSVGALGGVLPVAGPLTNLARASGATQLSGEGTTSRDIVIGTILTARVSSVLPNGVMLVEAVKDIQINSERQTVTVRGLVRPADIGPDNSVRSDRLGELEVRVNGKGVVGDAIRRPFILYRLLLGLLPF